ncbi:MAG: hypothetical protein ABIC04_02185 [Nanoarchaeota archaeon]
MIAKDYSPRGDIDEAIKKYASKPAEFDLYVNDVFGQMNKNSVDSVIECLQDVEELIVQRQALHKELTEDLNKHEVEISNFIAQFSTLRIQDQGVKRELIMIKSKVIELIQSKREEQLQCWQDIAKLKEERRQLQRELSEKKGRMALLSSILSEK